MIQLFTWPTPNGQKVQIMLEELGVAYGAVPINILRGEQFAADFLAISPNNKIPAIT
ncbi:MAG: thiol:disulfide oxidoreductase, partial [Tardiphaga sp.]|nr:thiol:disulfide oxidoreductase [Tardiphaga sp.]